MYPNTAIIEPKLTISLSEEQTLYPGLDATSHALEAIWNKNSSETSNKLAKKALGLISSSLQNTLLNPSDLKNRTNMQNASLFSGIAISSTKTAIAHSISCLLYTSPSPRDS